MALDALHNCFVRSTTSVKMPVWTLEDLETRRLCCSHEGQKGYAFLRKGPVGYRHPVVFSFALQTLQGIVQ